ncbi:MAG: tetratricopeptide repeat protein [Betaproteobacteria bacterium]
MTLFVVLSLILAVLTVGILVYRGPVVADVTDPATAAIAVTRPTRGLVIALALLIVVVTGAGYAWIGSPRLLPVTPDAPPGPGPSADAQLATLQARAEQHPTDAMGWYQAARAQLALGHAPEAANDYRSALALRPNDANLMADLADVLAVVGQGRLDGEPMQLVERALAIDPNHVKALALKGSYAMTQRDFRTALGAWNQALKVAQPDDPIAQFLKTQLDGMREMAEQAGAAASAAR